MQVIIPAAGKGLRFHTLGKLYPKCILPVENLPLIVYNIRIIKLISSVENITVVVSKSNYQDILSIIKFYFPVELKSRYICLVIYEKGLFGVGPASSILAGISNKFSSYLVILSDIIIPDNFKSFKFESNVLSVKQSKDSKRWCVVKNIKNKLVFYDKKVLTGKKHAALSGIYYIHEGKFLIEAMSKLKKINSKKELEISILLKYIANKTKFCLKYLKVTDYGTLEEYLVNNKIANSRKFNSVKVMSHDLIIKSNKSKEFNFKILDEISWYKFMNKNFPKFAAKINILESLENSYFPSTSYVIEKIKYPTLSQNLLYLDRSLDLWGNILNALFDYFDECTKYQKLPGSFEKQRIYQNTLERYKKLPLDFKKELDLKKLINSIENLTIFNFETYLHGDMVFSNIFFDGKRKRIRLIDPLGKINGNLIYDLAKLFQSVIFKYDFIVSDLYFLRDDRIFLFDRNLEPIRQLFLQGFVKKFGKDIVLSALKLAGILFLNLIPLHYDRKDHQKIFFEISKKIIKVDNNLEYKKVLNNYLKII